MKTLIAKIASTSIEADETYFSVGGFVFDSSDYLPLQDAIAKAHAKHLELRVLRNRLRLEDIKDGAVLYSGGKHWRKIVKMPNDTYCVVDDCGSTQWYPAHPSALHTDLLRNDYTREKRA